VETAAGAAVMVKSAVGGGVEGDEEPHPVRRQKQQLEIQSTKDCFKTFPQDRIRYLGVRFTFGVKNNPLTLAMFVSDECNNSYLVMRE
jgi:hypothetical protein